MSDNVNNDQPTGQVIIREAQQLYNSMPKSSLDFPPEFSAQMTAFANQQSMSTAMLVSSVKHQMMSMFSATVEHLSGKIQETETVLKHQIQQAQKDMSVELKMMKDKIIENDPIKQAWRRPENIHLRQLIGYIMHAGPNTIADDSTTTRIFHFFFPRGSEETEDNLMVAIPISLIRLLVLNKSCFSPEVVRGVQTHITKIIQPVFECVTSLPADEVQYVSAQFPCKIFNSGGLYIFQASHLVDMMKEELSYEEKGQGVTKVDAEFKVYTWISEDGSLTADKDRYDAKGVKALNAALRQVRELYSCDPEDLNEMAKKRVKKNIKATGKVTDKVTEKKRSKQAVWDFVRSRNYWGLEASKSFLESNAFQMGVIMVRKGVWNDYNGEFNDGPSHVNGSWGIDRSIEVRDFATILSEAFLQKRSHILTVFGQELDEEAFFENDVDSDIDSDDEHEVDSDDEHEFIPSLETCKPVESKKRKIDVDNKATNNKKNKKNKKNNKTDDSCVDWENMDSIADLDEIEIIESTFN